VETLPGGGGWDCKQAFAVIKGSLLETTCHSAISASCVKNQADCFCDRAPFPAQLIQQSVILKSVCAMSTRSLQHDEETIQRNEFGSNYFTRGLGKYNSHKMFV
jgi:hypothetical protein